MNRANRKLINATARRYVCAWRTGTYFDVFRRVRAYLCPTSIRPEIAREAVFLALRPHSLPTSGS